MYEDSTIRIYADGACRGNQSRINIGAYAYKLTHFDRVKTFAQVEENTTNNIMELKSVIEALKALKLPAANCYQIEVYSDSQYVVSGINEWIKGWCNRGFDGVKNVNLWKELLQLKNQFKNITFNKVKGHSGHNGNEEVDRLCNEAMDKYLQERVN